MVVAIMLDTGMILAVLAVGTWGLSELVTKVALDKQPLWKILVISQLFGGAIVLVLLRFTDLLLLDLQWYVYLLLLGLMNYLGMVFFYKGLQSKGIVLTSPIMHSWAFVTILLSVWIFGERMDVLQTVAVVAVMAGVLTTTVRSSKLAFDASFIPAVASMVIFGLYFLILKNPNIVLGAVIVTGLVKIFTGIFAVPEALRTNSFSERTSLKQYLLILAVGLLDGGGFLLYNMAVHLTDLWLATVIVSLVPVIGVLLGVVVLKERVKFRKSIGVSLALFGLILLSL